MQLNFHTMANWRNDDGFEKLTMYECDGEYCMTAYDAINDWRVLKEKIIISFHIIL